MNRSIIVSVQQVTREQLKHSLPSSLYKKTHFSKQSNCWSLRCSWSIACRRCSNYIFILHLTPGFNILRKDNAKQKWETFEFSDLVRLILEILRYLLPIRDGGYQANFLRPVIFIIVHQIKFYLSNITFTFDRSRRSSAALTAVKYECDSGNLTGTFCKI